MNHLGRGRLSSLLTRATLFFFALLFAIAEVRAQSSQSSCVVTTRGGTDALDVVFLMECSNAETVGALHFDVQAVSGPSSSDRNIEVVFILSPSSEGRAPTTHRQTILLKEGATSARGLMPFVMNSTTDSAQQRSLFWNVGVYEEGRDIERTRMFQANPGGQYVPMKLAPGEPPPYLTHQRGGQNGSVLHILDSGARLDTELASRMTPSYIQSAGSGAGPIDETRTFDLARNFLRATSTRHVESLPEYWHYYLQFNVVTLDLQVLAKLRAERPRAAEALKQYVAAGGDLLFVSRGADGPRQIDQWLMNRDDAHKPADWATDNAAFMPRSVILSEEDELQALQQQLNARLSDPSVKDAPTESSNDSTTTRVQYKRFATRAYARGRVICFENTRNNALPQAFVGAGRTPSVGIAVSSVNDGSWSLRNLIASVGKPPVWTFCGIILLFGFILGPGLLILTGWIGRRSLLILLVPLVSIGATLAIVGYEVLHEGFGTYARITSVLNIDERSGEGFVWSRQNYFSGWPPRDGLSIPSDVYCRPVGGLRMGRSGAPRNSSNFQYSVEHKADETILSGVLQAREQKQLLIGHPAKLSMPIQVKRIDDKRATLRNLTDETLPFVVLRDGKSGYYFTEQLAPNAEIVLDSVPFGDFAGALSRLRSELAPALPAELRAIGWAVAQEQATEVLDQEWISSMAEQSTASTIPPYGFVTLIRNCSGVFVPLKATSSESLHLVTGSAVW